MKGFDSILSMTANRWPCGNNPLAECYIFIKSLALTCVYSLSSLLTIVILETPLRQFMLLRLAQCRFISLHAIRVGASKNVKKLSREFKTR